ncbi:MAG: acyl carrier protein phosphodiesterase [Calditrichia bacterium]
MNFLAHLAVGHITNTSPSGNLAADFFKGDTYLQLPEVIRKGILMHRFVDSFGHQDPAYQAANRLLQNDWGKISGILSDLLFDHFLAKRWVDYFPKMNYHQFITRQYSLLWEDKSYYDDHIIYFLTKLIEQNWLGKYPSIEGMNQIMNQFSHRKSFLAPLKEGVQALTMHYREFDYYCSVFFPSLFSASILFSQRLNELT